MRQEGIASGGKQQRELKEPYSDATFSGEALLQIFIKTLSLCTPQGALCASVLTDLFCPVLFCLWIRLPPLKHEPHMNHLPSSLYSVQMLNKYFLNLCERKERG